VNIREGGVGRSRSLLAAASPRSEDFGYVENIIVFVDNLVRTLKVGQLPEFGYWSYLILAMLVLIEGPVATLLAAAAASAGLMRPMLVFIAAAVGNLTADTLWWLLGYAGKTEWIHSFGRRLRIRESLIEHLKHNMIKHATRVLFLAKVTMSFSIPALIAAGLLRVKWRRWFPALVAAETLWTGSLVLIGYYTAEATKRVERNLEYAALAVSIAFVVFLILEGRRLVRQLDREELAAALPTAPAKPGTSRDPSSGM
jgi:membrane protein DedA with SNARE-associated domain